MMRLFHASDLDEMNGWYAARGQSPLSIALLPEYGVLEPGVAAGFLYRTDAPSLGLLDGFVSNPEAPLRERAEALKEIAAHLVQSAKRQGVVILMAMCKSRGIERLAGRMGLHPIGMYVVSAKELR